MIPQAPGQFLDGNRTTLISLIAIPLSLAVTALAFHLLGQSINVMTMGGLAIAIGELVDNAMVDVENIVRRLKQRGEVGQERGQSMLETIWHASVEVRSGIVYATVIVVLVFVPLFRSGAAAVATGRIAAQQRIDDEMAHHEIPAHRSRSRAGFGGRKAQ